MKGRPGGLFRWKWIMGRFDNMAQVGNALHVLYDIPVHRVAEFMGAARLALGEDAEPRAVWNYIRRNLL